jgi:CHASE3 domain sensor protein
MKISYLVYLTSVVCFFGTVGYSYWKLVDSDAGLKDVNEKIEWLQTNVVAELHDHIEAMLAR